MEDVAIKAILEENRKRNEAMHPLFDPITGEGSIGERVRVCISDFAIPVQFLPEEMMSYPLVRKLSKRGSIEAFLRDELKIEPNAEDYLKVSRKLLHLRYLHDFPFWAASLVKIHNKDGGEDVYFRLRHPQRILVSRFEKCRKGGEPIRLVLLKARQWGGSTTTQLYMMWLQFFHMKGLNSLIIAHQGAASDEIKDMFETALNHYPVEFLHEFGEMYSEDEAKLENVGKSGSTSRVPQRNCKIKIGSAERPDGCRGGAYSLVHLSEVGIWKKTEGKSPEDIVRSACSGVLYKPYTMIVMESTPNGTGNFFHSEYKDAVNPDVPSQFEALFIAWFEIEQYALPFESEEAKVDFARRLLAEKDNDKVFPSREESGKYHWWLWQKGATLEALNWYIKERAGKNEHAVMASEYPSDDVEAFVHSGQMVFDKYNVDDLRKYCRRPLVTGEVSGNADRGDDALEGVHFSPDAHGSLQVWEHPEKDEGDTFVTDRYLTVVDIGGRSAKADWSVVVVFDRLDMIDGDKPKVVAQWYGHTDIDLLAWKAAQIASYYNDSLLVIESNTLETHDKERQIEGGDQSQYILNQISGLYPNLYARKQSEEEIREGLPRKYGFHTNVATKPMVISTLIRAVRDKLYTERDERCLDEFMEYEKKPNGAYGAVLGKHDDLLMTRAIGLHICFHEMDAPRILKTGGIKGGKKNGLISEAVW